MWAKENDGLGLAELRESIWKWLQKWRIYGRKSLRSSCSELRNGYADKETIN